MRHYSVKSKLTFFTLDNIVNDPDNRTIMNLIQEYKTKSVSISSYINWFQLQYVPSHVISYLEFGDPKNENILICAPGLTRNAHDFDKIALKLSDNFRVISISYPGRGDSDYFKNPKHYNYYVYVKDTLLLLKKLNIKKPIWLGTSMGGIIGMILASRYQGIFKAMIINDVGPVISHGSLNKIKKYATQKHLFNDIDSCKTHLKMIYSQFGISCEEDWDYMTKYSFHKTEDDLYQMNYDSAIIDGIRIDKKNHKQDVVLWEIWRKITCKLLLIHGAKSEILTEATIDQMKKTRDFDIYRVDYAGHAPSLMTNDQIDFIKNWL
jgi:pimeloyl-ACP methyl ester carboxylesterase